jgi:predicted GIY-YIG superfamily endonuclease
MPTLFWTKEKCHEAALKCKTRSEFSIKYSGGYDAAIKNKWLEEIFSHMQSVQKPSGYWVNNKDRCAIESAKYNSRKEFALKSPAAYQAAQKKGWLNEICSHMTSNQKPHNFWNKHRCEEEAKKLKTLQEFDDKNTSACQAARKNGWLDEIGSHFVTDKHKPGYWNKERCSEEALKYKSRKEFQKKSGSAFGSAVRNKWLDEICAFMERVGNRHHKLVYAYEFPDKSVYVGLTFNIRKRQWQRDHTESDAVTKYIQKTGLTPIRKLLTDYISVDKAIEREGFYIESYRDLGWDILNTAKAGSIGGDILIKLSKEECVQLALQCNSKNELKKKFWSVYNISLKNKWLNDVCAHMVTRMPYGYWTEDLCRIEALKYKSKTEFKKSNGYAYRSAVKNKWLNEISMHMQELFKPNGFWTKDACAEAASKCKSRSEFQRKNQGGYQAAQINGWLNEICRHMIYIHRPKWSKEECKAEALKYKTRTAFNKKSSGAYTAAWKARWLDDICTHMK